MGAKSALVAAIATVTVWALTRVTALTVAARTVGSRSNSSSNRYGSNNSINCKSISEE